MWKTAGAHLVVAVLLAWTALARPAGADVAPPPGFRIASSEALAPGLEVLSLVRERPAQVVHVAKVQPGPGVALRAVLSNGAVAGGDPRLERTSSMCARLRCLMAVNADFAFPDSGQPVGGLVSLGELVRSPNQQHHQLLIGADGALRTGQLAWSGTLVPTDLRPLVLDGVNVPRGRDMLVVYTPTFGPSTEANPHGVELALEIVRPEPPLRIGQTAIARP